jgi:hypothetical protein
MKEVQVLMRHSSIAITADTYTSILPEVASGLAEAMAAMVPRKGARGTAGLPSGSRARTGTDGSRLLTSLRRSGLVGRLGLEPRTYGLKVRCSAIELTPLEPARPAPTGRPGRHRRTKRTD